MRVAIQETKRLRSAFSFTASAAIHASVLAWVALAPLVPPARPSLYDQEIRPYEGKIVWYNLNEKLPQISPGRQEKRPARARERSRQTLVAGPRDDRRPPQLIWTPAPEIEADRMVPAPNVVALTPASRPLRDFTAPAEAAHPPAVTPALPDAPQVALAEPKLIPVAPPARPQPRPFTRRAEESPAAAPPVLPAAPELTIAAERAPNATLLLPPVQPARRTFIPPAEAAQAPLPRPANLPAAPAIEARDVAAVALPTGTAARALRPFSAPAGAPQATASASLAEAPAVTNQPAQAALAIVGLFPAREATIPAPDSSRRAGFSAGPQPRNDGSDASAETSLLTVPGLLVHSETNEAKPPSLMAALEAPTSRANLAAAARSGQPGVSGTSSEALAPRVAAAPDPRLAGRVVYSTAIQMPNISSYSGSWIVWFAERDPLRGQPLPNMRAPLPLRKVDPKYIPAAFDEKVEGKVRLAAVINKDGRVERVELLQHLDTRLDESSLEALAKWEFQPAARNGTPVDVDAVFEIPFHIAPKAAK